MSKSDLMSISGTPSTALICLAALALSTAGGTGAWGAGDHRSIDGQGNNHDHARAGAVNARLLRLTDAAYADGRGSPGGANRPNSREISNRVVHQKRRQLDPQGASDMFWVWGQFLDHDIDLTGGMSPVEKLDIAVPAGDPFFDPTNSGRQVIRFNRSIYDPVTGHSRRNPRQQLNLITAYIDASNVYGSDAERAAALRANDGSGELLLSDGRMLPFNEGGFDNAGGTHKRFRLAGDIRANENVALLSMHTLWAREHNRQARLVRDLAPGLKGDRIYQRARAKVIGLVQSITYNEFLPRLLGKSAQGRYRGWRRRVDAGICTEFSTAAYRFGHSMVSPRLLRLRHDGKPISRGHLRLRDAFFAPQELTADIGIEPYLRGATAQTALKIDTMMVDELRNFLFGRPEAGGFDLAALNIQRGRDHGLADFNTVREGYGLARLVRFNEVAHDPRIAAELRKLYRDIDDIDLWVGIMAERHAPGAMVGPTARAILAEQFQRLRDGDRFFYKRAFKGTELADIEGTTLADVIRRNTRIDDEIDDNVFTVR
ncbi:MAG TPA: peroxidase family protein [Acidobacteriota bacterium]|nr:peroxidase family protein [Acidobacteriota bacterium]